MPFSRAPLRFHQVFMPISRAPLIVPAAQWTSFQSFSVVASLQSSTMVSSLQSSNLDSPSPVHRLQIRLFEGPLGQAPDEVLRGSFTSPGRPQTRLSMGSPDSQGCIAATGLQGPCISDGLQGSCNAAASPQNSVRTSIDLSVPGQNFVFCFPFLLSLRGPFGPQE
ncbi:hypothetical protein GOODEAATRI_023890 [Goodea atripinnis]|uniref:Uncharacterized protein n=1 Tax=Goodea atripinnis TaxID=208336 RepID=A0ABV0NN44_9TELE